MSFARRRIESLGEKVRDLLGNLSISGDGAESLGRDIVHEYEERKAGYGKGVDPTRNVVGAIAGSSSKAAARRKANAQERHRKVRSDRQYRASRAQAAYEKTRQRAQRANANRARSTSGGKRKVPQSKASELEQHYKTLEVSTGASLPEVKKAYRTLMRKYHPDRHAGNPKKEKAATELSMRVSRAYEALEKHLSED